MNSKKILYCSRNATMTGTLSVIPIPRHEILRVEWTVDFFLSLKPVSGISFYHSPKFRFADDSFYFRLIPYGADESIKLYLKHDDSFTSLPVKFTLAVKKNDGSLYSKTSLIWKFQDQDEYESPCVLLRTHLLQRKDEFLFLDALTFSCILQKVPPLEALDALSLDLKKLQASSAQSDVTFKLKSREYRAHRAVLAARSDVFASALRHDTLEKETGIIRIQDCDPESFGQFLQHLYTGRADINEDNVFHLYRTADKYLVGELKSQCVAFLVENLSVGNFCDAVALAIDYGEKGLEKFCEFFFIEYDCRIMGTSGWKSLRRSHSDAVFDLIFATRRIPPIKKFKF